MQCAAGWDQKTIKAEYKGIKTCEAANLVFGGGVACEYGCMGLGDCARVCPFDAIYMDNGLPKVVIEKCTGCGKCEEACPRAIIEIQEKKFERIFYVACSSKDTILRTRQVCKVGCIACGICEKLSPEKLFVVKDNLSRANYSKQSEPERIEVIQAKCPTKVIKDT